MKILTSNDVIYHGWQNVSVITADMIKACGYTQIGDYAFWCLDIKSITIPEGITSIGKRAFYNCSSLTSVTIPNSVTSIGECAFSDCSRLTSIEISNNVTNIGDYAFCGCSHLTSIVVEAGNPNYDSRNNCNAIIETATNTLIAGCKNTIIPDSVTKIRNYSFYCCTSLRSITIPDSVIYIGNGAFLGCRNLSSISIPNNILFIGEGAFRDCGITFRRKYDSQGRLIAYKGFNKNMQCFNHFQYVEGHTYRTNKAKLCECGFHACFNPLDIFAYYSGEINKEIYIHEVYLDDVSMETGENSKVVAKRITIGKRLTIEDINKIIQKK